MVRLSFVLLSFVVALFCVDAMGAQSSNIYPDCTVAEVLSVYDGVSFSCKAGGDDLLGGIRLRVSIRGIDKATDKAAAVKFIKKHLAEAKYVKLKNVYMRNYFRVIADVELDGKSLAKMLIKNRLAAPRLQDLSKVIDKRQSRDLWSKGLNKAKTTRDDGRLKAAKSYSHVGRRVHRGMIDVSVFDSDMRFEDALEIVRMSVDPPLPIAVMWSEIENNAFIDKDTPIGFSGSGQMTPGGALRLLISSMDEIGTGLQYVIGDGIITIASTEMKLGRKYLGVYDVSPLIAMERMPMYGGGYGNSFGRQGGNGYGSSYGNNYSSSFGNNNRNINRRSPSGGGFSMSR